MRGAAIRPTDGRLWPILLAATLVGRGDGSPGEPPGPGITAGLLGQGCGMLFLSHQ
jgi:hypothetical protein